MTAEFDAVVVGAGHNGLILGAYLAKSGLSVLVCENRWEVGGSMDTRELFPGFKFNLHATYNVVHGLNPPVYRDLELEKFGLRWKPCIGWGVVFGDNRALFYYPELKHTLKLVERFSQNDARLIERLFSKENIEKYYQLARTLFYTAPHELENPASEAGRIYKTTEGYERFPFDSTMMEAAEENFESPEVQTWLMRIVEASMMEPSESSAWTLMWINSLYLNLGIAVGGTHSIAHVLARVIQYYGGMIIERDPAVEILIENERAVGVRLKSGKTVRARKLVASNLNPSLTLELIGEENVPSEIVKKVKNYRYRYTSHGSIAIALKRKPSWKASEFTQDVNSAMGLSIGWESPENFVRMYEAHRKGEIYKDDNGFMAIEAVSFLNEVEPTLAPPGYHVITPAWPYFPNTRYAGEKFIEYMENNRQELLEWAIESIMDKMQDMKRDDIIGATIYLPTDVEKKNPNMYGGDINVGTFEGQSMWHRPFPEWGKYRAYPVENLYLCGPSSHSGGGIKFSNGYLCYKTIKHDLGLGGV